MGKSIFEDKGMQLLEIEKCRRNVRHWLFNWVITKDEHDDIHPYKNFPLKSYFFNIIDAWETHNLLLIPKSRQMMITWLMINLYLWDVIFKRGRLVFFQSKKEKDADELLLRCLNVINNLPSWLRPKFKYKYCELEIPLMNSRIKAIPQGGDQLRSYTASGVFIDEMAFMPEARDTITACKPAIVGGGKITCVSSANPSFFELLVNDREIDDV